VELTPTLALKTLTPDPTTLRVDVPHEKRESLRAAGSSGGMVVLHVDGVEIPADRGALVKVYLGHPEATAETPTSDPHYVGSIVAVPAIPSGSSQKRPAVKRNYAFDITQHMQSTSGENNTISVTLVPFRGEGIKPAEVSLSYRRVYVMIQ
jgi:hypothetical protein